jgi:putative peptide zinc metalloprotease protein
MLAVALFVSANYFVVGVGMAFVTVFLRLVWPVTTALWVVVTGPRYRLCRGRAAGLTFGGIAAAGAALLYVPAPAHGNAEGVIWTPRDSIVRAETDGFILRVLADEGAKVEAGAPLFAMEHPIAEAWRRVSAAKAEELKAKYDAQ